MQNKSGAQPNFVPLGTTWGSHRIITYFFQNGTPDITLDDERQAIRDGFAIWAAATDLYFIEVCSAGAADIEILWGAGAHGHAQIFDGASPTGLVLAHAAGPPGPGSGTEAGDIHFDEDETWSLATQLTAAQPIDLVSVAAHEIGHSLGLDHTSVSGSLMLPVYTGSHRYLGSDDLAGITSLYGSFGAALPISGPSLICSTGSYSISDLPSGASVSWSTTNPVGLSINSSGDVTRNYSYNGPIGIHATVTGSCGSTTVTKLAWVGDPDEGWISTEASYVGSGAGKVISPWGYTGLGAAYQITGYPSGIGSISEYHWTINDHSNWNIIPLNGDASSVELEYWNSPTPFNQKIYIRAKNACGGWSPYLETTWTFSSFFAKYSVSPNPASDYVTLLFEDLVNSNGLPELVELMSENSTTPIKSLSTTSSSFESVKNNNNKLSIPVSDLPRGTYYLHVSYGNKKNPDKHRVVLE